MSLFSRKSRRGEQDAAAEDATPDVAVDEAEEADDDVAGPEADVDDWPSGGLSDRSQGPWDESEVDDADGYLDLGALRVRLRGADGADVQGLELRLDVDEQGGQVTAATLVHAGSAVQLQVFAAPRRSGIWDEIRGEIGAGITKQGGTVDDVPGAFGRELLAQLPVRSPDGRVGVQPIRFTGVDGPRWFLRAVFHGPAAFDHDQASVLEGLVRDVVVVRGPDAMAPRDLLPLRLPQTEEAVAAQAEADAREPLEPFRRGPEITEIR